MSNNITEMSDSLSRGKGSKRQILWKVKTYQLFIPGIQLSSHTFSSREVPVLNECGYRYLINIRVQTFFWLTANTNCLNAVMKVAKSLLKCRNPQNTYHFTSGILGLALFMYKNSWIRIQKSTEVMNNPSSQLQTQNKQRSQLLLFGLYDNRLLRIQHWRPTC